MTDRSPEVMWALTKRFNANKTKFMGKHWTTSVFSNTGRHCASEAANTIGISVRKTKTDKNFKRTFTMTLKHKARHGIAKVKKGSQRNPAVSVQDIGRDPNHAAKIIKKQRFLSEADRSAALRKLAKLADSTGKKAAKAQ